MSQDGGWEDYCESISEEVRDAAWEYITLNYEWLDKLVFRACGGRHDLVDEMYADVVPRAVMGAVNSYDSRVSTLRGHVSRAVKLHALKWWYRRRRYYSKHSPIEALDYESHVAENDLDSRVEVSEILEALHPYYRGILTMYHFADMTFEEIGDALDVSKGTARNHYLEALRAAKQFLGVD